jgi:serine/threonine-protein kinase
MDMSEAHTVAAPPVVRPPSTESLDKARFVPGTMLAGRYRVVALLGRGGMGEVYRAEDLTLGQPVALKFLPDEVAHDSDRLARFRQEVRVARQVSHPNVCRVYDIGEADGQPFISMEYVDGEDLASLLRRIGRLPSAKATELARQVCAGLAAAHDRGVLHRDLKPANVMIDERGRARIADFGLAGIAGAEGDRERGVIMGTPGYMAPEQFAGQGSSTRSDVYALGLVLYELFTGQPAHAVAKAGGGIDVARADASPSPSTIVADLDPAIERVILRCLEHDPARRPSSALAVASALPGGDPLAAALAAGETPSPEMVAAAAETDRVSMRTIGICTVTIAVGLVASAILGGLTNPLEQTPSDQPPVALEQQARDLVRSFGYQDLPVDRAYGLYYDDSRRWMRANETPEVYKAQLANGQPAGFLFWYRQSPQYLEPPSGVGDVSPTNPPMLLSGMIRMHLDPQGRLVEFEAVPQQVQDAAVAPSPAADWAPLLTAAELDMARFTPAAPSWLPPTPFDARAAWIGSFVHTPDVPIRIEAAAWRGRPVYFTVIGPWSRPARDQPQRNTAGQERAATVVLVLFAIVSGIAVLFAWRHVRQGRADLRGASRAGAVLFGCSLVDWALRANHVPTNLELTRFSWALSGAAFYGASFWALYVALEPYVRRRWPQSLISWSRLIGGGIRHPLVGGHLLVGLAFGVAYIVLFEVRGLLQGVGYSSVLLTSVVDTPRMLSTFILPVISSSQLAMGMFFVFFLLRVLIGRPWLAAIVFIVLGALPSTLASPQPLIAGSEAVLQFGLAIFILSRFGILPMVVGIFVSTALPAFPLTTTIGTWYAASTLFAFGSLVTLTAYALYTAIDRRPLVGEGFLERA